MKPDAACKMALTAKSVHPEWVRQEVIDYLRESAIFSVERLSYLTGDDLKVCCEGVKWDVGINEAKIRGQRVSLKTAWKKLVKKQARYCLRDHARETPVWPYCICLSRRTSRPQLRNIGLFAPDPLMHGLSRCFQPCGILCGRSILFVCTCTQGRR